MSAENYVFVSYAHKDSQVVLPCVEVMKKHGINVWFDEGIQAGSEWPEYIAEKVASCTKFILFISPAYLDSQNCKRELNFAISRKKDILSVFIEDVQLTLGVEMQLGTYQSIFRKRFANDSVFYQSLCGEAWFNDCRIGGSAAPSSAQASGAPSSSSTQNATAQAAAAQSAPTPAAPVQFAAPMPQKAVSAQPAKSRIVAALLAIFLGGIGIHKFYLGHYVLGTLYIVFSLTGIPSIIATIEGILMLISTDEKFQKQIKRPRYLK